MLFRSNGPFASTSFLQDRSGVYAIIDEQGDKNYLVDVGESKNVRTRVETHDRKSCWSNRIKGRFKVAVLYTPNKQQAGRMEIEQEIRNEFDMPCGEK